METRHASVPGGWAVSGRALALLLAFCWGTQWSVAETTLIAPGTVWRFSSNGAAQPNAWRGVVFDDSAWSSGAAKLGYGEGDEVTVIADAASAPVTVYFRHSFTVTNRAEFTTLTLRLRRDDGAVVYLNSNEVYRSNLPVGPIQYTTPATNVVDGTGETEFIQRSVSPYFLVSGTNVIAVELHQHPAGRNDASFDFALIGNIPNTYPSIALNDPEDGAVLAPGNMRLSASASDADGYVYRVTFHAGKSLSQAETNIIASRFEPPFEFTWPNVPVGRYVISAQATDNSGRTTRSPWVHVQVGSVQGDAILRGPYLQSGSPTGMVVRWLTDWFVSSRLRYGTNAANLDQVVSNDAKRTAHEMHLGGLQPDTKYYYSVGTDSRVLASGPTHFFRTSPTNARPVRLWVIGDSGTGNHTPHAAQVRDSYLDYSSRMADLWLMLGDNAYEVGTDAEYQTAVFEMYPTILRNTVLWPTLGNHDAGSGGDFGEFPYLDIFTLPRQGEAGGVASGTERYYSFDYANIHFVCLDAQSSDRTRPGPMLRWLENDLGMTDKDWIIAYWHQPPYTFGTHNSDFELDLVQMRQNAVPILERYGADLVLCGHSHVYERSFLIDGHYGFSSSFDASMIVQPGMGREGIDGAYEKPAGGLGANRGTVYAVCGCSGEGGEFSFPRHPAMARNLAGFGSMIIDVDGLRLDAKFLRSDGSVDDYFTLRKGMPGDDVRPMLAVRRDGAQVQLTWPTSLAPFRLEGATSVGEVIDWAPVIGTLNTVGREHRVNVPLTGTNRLFRLRSDED
jgi:Calcineurin-like phosphoesterase/Purple acid Phosphatase, N-terminal domain/Bacterial Ig domain